MEHSVTPVLDSKVNALGECKIYLRVICGRKKVDFSTGIKVRPSQWNNESRQVIKKPKSIAYNRAIEEKRELYKSRLETQSDTNLTPAQIKELLTKSEQESAASTKVLVADYIYDLRDKYAGSPWSAHYTRLVCALANKIAKHRPKDGLSDVTINWMISLEKTFRNEDGNSENSTHTRLKILKTIFAKAEAEGLMSDSQFKRYKLPRYTSPMPSYLTQEELSAFTKAVEAATEPYTKIAGSYFLFSCASGLRISDMKKFSAERHVMEDAFVLRATKNHSIVTMPLYPRLKESMERIKNVPFAMSEQTGNLKLKQLAASAGIEKKKMSFHVGRHTFAMLMLRNGLTIDEVAKLLGDTVDVARIYASISNDQIHRRVRELLY